MNRGREYHIKNISWKKGKGKQYHLSYNIGAVREEYPVGGKGEGDGNFGEKSSLSRMGVGKNIKLEGTIYTPA